MNKKNIIDIKIGDIVYHRSVYEHGEALEVIGITADKLFLEGDFSGGTHLVKQSEWLPITGTSRIKNHAFKMKSREEALSVQLKAQTTSHDTDSISYKTMMSMVNYVLKLTIDVHYNPEY